LLCPAFVDQRVIVVVIEESLGSLSSDLLAVAAFGERESTVGTKQFLHGGSPFCPAIIRLGGAVPSDRVSPVSALDSFCDDPVQVVFTTVIDKRLNLFFGQVGAEISLATDLGDAIDYCCDRHPNHHVSVFNTSCLHGVLLSVMREWWWGLYLLLL
jgi:hypothetical protein